MAKRPPPIRRPPPVLAFLLLSFGIAAAGPAAAERVELRYRAAWGGLDAAEMVLSVAGDGGEYHSRLIIEARGLAERLLGLTVEAFARGRSGEFPRPELWQMASRTHDSERILAVAFDPATTLAAVVRNQETRLTTGASEEDEGEEVPDDLRLGVVDPLTALMTLRERTRRALEGGIDRFTLPIFDGRRRYDFAVSVEGPAVHGNGRGGQVETVDVHLTMQPRAGFRPMQQKIWSGARFRVWLDRQRLLPLRIETDSLIAPAVIRRAAACPPDPSCTLTAGR